MPKRKKAEKKPDIEYISRDDVYDMLDEEREYQIKTFGDLDDRNSVADFLCYIKRYYDNAVDANNPDDPYPAVMQVLKIGALAIACLERHGIAIY